ncbi:MAG: hypothetical protein FIB08_03735 [Candidatus Methanoperedens sp.]|nr:hypothetical protein [Candidatus Methanoperedens sp.]
MISEEMIGTAIISAILGLSGGYFTFRLTTESRIKDLEHEVKLLQPIKNILLEIGSKNVEEFFKGVKK